MSYYIGTKSACETYNEKVSNHLGLNGNKTSQWSDVTRHPSEELYKVAKHHNYTSEDLTLVETLPSDWTPEIP